MTQPLFVWHQPINYQIYNVSLPLEPASTMPMTTTSSHIFLENVRFYAYHGVAPQETLVGNEFTISLQLKVDFGRAAETDEVTDTVSYADVYEVLKEEMAVPSKLLEHVCGRIVRRLFHDFSEIEEVSIRLGKRNPPMGADIDTAGVEMVCKKTRTNDG